MSVPFEIAGAEAMASPSTVSLLELCLTHVTQISTTQIAALPELHTDPLLDDVAAVFLF
jgi:hypothetical protein